MLDSRLHTDEAHHYRKPGQEFATHERVNHSEEEYARGDVTTNTVEGFFSIFKRGMRGVYQHCSEQHLQRYLDEFDFRYSNRSALGVEDAERTARAIKGAEGKRLTFLCSPRDYLYALAEKRCFETPRRSSAAKQQGCPKPGNATRLIAGAAQSSGDHRRDPRPHRARSDSDGNPGPALRRNGLYPPPDLVPYRPRTSFNRILALPRSAQ